MGGQVRGAIAQLPGNLLTFLIHAYLTQTAQVTKLLDAAKIVTKILTLWVGRNNVTDDRHRRTAHAIRIT